MAAENSIGLLLERFIASVLEPHGWIWCSGNIIRAVDLIDPSSGTLLQIKTRQLRALFKLCHPQGLKHHHVV